jgi:hypothetical protein
MDMNVGDEPVEKPPHKFVGKIVPIGMLNPELSRRQPPGRRECWFFSVRDRDWVRGFFHAWGSKADLGRGQTSCAIVEDLAGGMWTPDVQHVKFGDFEDGAYQYLWFSKEGKRCRDQSPLQPE